MCRRRDRVLLRTCSIALSSPSEICHGLSRTCLNQKRRRKCVGGLRDDMNSLEWKALGIFPFLRDHYRSASFQRCDLPVNMQHLRLEKRRAVTSDNRACIRRCAQSRRLGVQCFASNSISAEQMPARRYFTTPDRVILSQAKLQRSGRRRSDKGYAFNLPITILTDSVIMKRFHKFKSRTARALPTTHGLGGRFAH